MPTPLSIASVNTNGVRAAYRKGMGDWLDERDVDILAIQEVRASTEDLEGLLGPEWNILHDAATAKGRAGVALASRGKASIHRVDPRADDFDSAGRWLEADYEVDGKIVTVVSTYVHSGEADTPKQVEKYKFLDAMVERLPELKAHNELALIVGDLNVGHRTLDIKNWKGNVKRAGFLPQERAYFDRFFGAEDDPRLQRRGRPRLGRRRPQVGGRGRRPVHLVVLARAGLRQRHRMAHRLPPGHAGPRRDRRRTTRSTGPRPTTSAGPTTRPVVVDYLCSSWGLAVGEPAPPMRPTTPALSPIAKRVRE